MDYTINTKCVQAGYTPGNGEPRQIPIIQSTTYKYDTSEDMGKLFDLEAEGYFYSRLQNPTNDYVAAKITALEGGTSGMLTSSGQAANFFAVFNICEAGSHIVSSSSIYGGTYNLLAVTMKKMGVDVTFVDPDCTEEELNAAFKENTRAVFGESIANPALTVLDIEKFAKAAHAHGVPLIVDNTFPTPVNLRPIEWGADIRRVSSMRAVSACGGPSPTARSRPTSSSASRARPRRNLKPRCAFWRNARSRRCTFSRTRRAREPRQRICRGSSIKRSKQSEPIGRSASRLCSARTAAAALSDGSLRCFRSTRRAVCGPHTDAMAFRYI